MTPDQTAGCRRARREAGRNPCDRARGGLHGAPSDIPAGALVNRRAHILDDCTRVHRRPKPGGIHAEGLDAEPGEALDRSDPRIDRERNDRSGPAGSRPL